MRGGRSHMFGSNFNRLKFSGQMCWKAVVSQPSFAHVTRPAQAWLDRGDLIALLLACDAARTLFIQATSDLCSAARLQLGIELKHLGWWRFVACRHMNPLGLEPNDFVHHGGSEPRLDTPHGVLGRQDPDVDGAGLVSTSCEQKQGDEDEALSHGSRGGRTA